MEPETTTQESTTEETTTPTQPVKEPQEVILTDEQFQEVLQAIRDNKPIPQENNTVSTAELSQNQMNHFTTMHNDSKQTDFTMFTIIIALLVGQIAVKGVLQHWKS